MAKENLPKKGHLIREFWAQNPPIWAAHTHTLNMLRYSPGLVMTRQRLVASPVNGDS